MIAFALIQLSLSSPEAVQQEPDVAAAYYGVDEGRELFSGESPYTSASAKHRTANQWARLNRTWLQRRSSNLSQRRMNLSTFGRGYGKSGFNPYMPYRPLLGSHRANATGTQKTGEHLYDLASAKKKALGLSGDSGKWSSRGEKSLVCCEQETADCMACRAHMPVIFYCRRYPTTPGCVDVRQRASPKSRSSPSGPTASKGEPQP